MVAIAIFTLDQATKHVVQHNLPPAVSVVVIPHLLEWTYVENTRGAFGLFGNQPWLLIVMAVVVLGVFWYSIREQLAHSAAVQIAFGMIAGGAVGNIVDRLQHGFVVDFIDFYAIWPFNFNVGDASITIGVGILLLSGLFAERAGRYRETSRNDG